MPDTTLEEASRCPKCLQPGEKRESKPVSEPRGARLDMFYCRNPRCPWCNTPWTVQINPDGTIPPPVTRREKKFPALDAAIAASVEGALQSQFEREQKPGAEVRGRW